MLETKLFKLNHAEHLNEGMQVLREYIHFCGLDFVSLCSRYDQFNEGITEKLIREALVTELAATMFYFTESNIMEIIKEAPTNKLQRIAYRELDQILRKSKAPDTSLNIFRNTVFKTKNTYKSKERLYYEEIAKAFAYETSNYFDRKASFEFKHFQLGQLDLELLASTSQYIYFEDPLKAKFAKFSDLNNHILLDNFQVMLAKRLATNALPQLASMFIVREKVEAALLDYLSNRKGLKMHPLLLREQFTPLVKVKLYNEELTQDEVDLLYWLIWRKFEFKAMTINCIVSWALEFREMKVKETFKIYDEKQKDTDLLLIPVIYERLQNICLKYSSQVLRQAFLAFLQGNCIGLEEFKLVLRTLEIGHSQYEFNEFRFYCANKGLMTIKEGKVLIKVDELIKALDTHTTAIEQEVSDVESAYVALFKSMILSIMDSVQKKAIKLMQADQMLEELQLRMLLSDGLHLIDQNALTVIINNLQHNIQPSVQKPTRQVYLPELLDLLSNRFVDTIKVPPPKVPTFEPPEAIIEEEFKARANTEGAFIGAPTRVFEQDYRDEKETLNKMMETLSKKFQSTGTKFEIIEDCCNKLCLHLKSFDPKASGSLNKDQLFAILLDLLGFTHPEILQLVDFALSVSRVDPATISYMFFCVQLNEYMQTQRLLT